MARFIGCAAAGTVLGVALMAIAAIFAVEYLDCSKFTSF